MDIDLAPSGVYESFRTLPLTAKIGAEIDGLDLSNPLTEQQSRELNAALARYEVLFFRDQPISHERHEALGQCFGPLAQHSAVPGIDGHPHIVAIHADENSTYIAGDSVKPHCYVPNSDRVSGTGGRILRA